MRGTTHALTGVAGGCLLAGALPGPLPARAVGLLLVVVGSLAPDIDSERATITRALWLVGALAHRLVIVIGRALFAATATEYDRDPWNDGHRLITHTAAGALAAGTVVAAGTWAAGTALTAALPTAGTWGWLLAWIGPGITAAWWLWGLAFAWGCLIHILGDCHTVQGCPIAWPIMIHGKRWWLVRAPLTVHAGSDEEDHRVVPVAVGMVIISALWMVGLWGPIFTLIESLAGSLG